ncbi:MAG: transposase [Aquabacterium sp.]|uniref:transposase n=1 Tax=Aquabacterium sp. TaxID=1872578 RepID=UPI003BE2EFBC
MARLPRLGLAAWPHLVVQRVHDGQQLARDDTDRQALITAMREAARLHGVTVHAYGVGAEHFVLLLTPGAEDAISLFMQAIGRRYVAAYNARHARQGGLWASRYRATVLDPARFLLDAMVFVETDGLRSGRVQRVEDDLWSSARHHLGLCTDALIGDHALFWALGNTPFERDLAWRRRLEEGISAKLCEDMAQAVHKGWALMAPEVAHGLEASAGRRLTPRPRGRPRKSLDS